MAVLVEAISVIVRRDAIRGKYPGGWQGFVAAVPNGTLCYDDDLARARDQLLVCGVEPASEFLDDLKGT